MEVARLKTFRAEALEMIGQSGFILSDKDLEALAVDDFGLGHFEMEGFVWVDLLRSPRVRTVLITLFPGQSLPQHIHPPYDDEPGKEETMRVLWGQARIYVPGEVNNPDISIPKGKEKYYSVFHQIVLNAGDQYSIPPNTQHWFQGGPDGAVTMTIQNRVDETRNVFLDPQSTGCPIKLTD